MTPQEKREFEQLKLIVASLIKTDTKIMTITKDIAHASGARAGFFGLTPKVQPTADTVNPATNLYSTAFFADATYSNNEMNQINNMWNAMIGLGLVKEI